MCSAELSYGVSARPRAAELYRVPNEAGCWVPYETLQNTQGFWSQPKFSTPLNGQRDPIEATSWTSLKMVWKNCKTTSREVESQLYSAPHFKPRPRREKLRHCGSIPDQVWWLRTYVHKILNPVRLQTLHENFLTESWNSRTRAERLQATHLA